MSTNKKIPVKNKPNTSSHLLHKQIALMTRTLVFSYLTLQSNFLPLVLLILWCFCFHFISLLVHAHLNIKKKYIYAKHLPNNILNIQCIILFLIITLFTKGNLLCIEGYKHTGSAPIDSILLPADCLCHVLLVIKRAIVKSYTVKKNN